MSCCGDKRALLRTQSALAHARAIAARPPAPAVQPAIAGQSSDTALRFLGQGTIVLRGPATSRVYYFVAGGDATVVDDRDVDAFLRTRLFAAGAS